MNEAATTETHWADDVLAAMTARQIEVVCTVPDGGLTRFLDLVADDPKKRLVTLSSEQEGMGIATGFWLGGKRAMIAMQSSGVGNCINAVGLPVTLRTPCLMLVTMRGQWGEFNPWQIPMGQGARGALELMGVKCFAVDKADEVAETFAAAADIAFNGQLAAAVLISQRVIGAKGFGQK